MAIVSVAIVVSFHLQHQPTAVEKRFALPFGIIFWILSLACLASGLANYLRTVTRYSRRAALVQSGWKTEMVRCLRCNVNLHANKALQVFTVVAVAIVAACVLLLSTNASTRNQKSKRTLILEMVGLA